LLLKTVTADDIEEVTRMWAFEKGSISDEASYNKKCNEVI